MIQYLTEKQNGFFLKWSLTGGGRLRKVVTMRELTVVIFDQYQGKHDLNKKIKLNQMTCSGSLQNAKSRRI